jgi:hypothetical protein
LVFETGTITQTSTSIPLPSTLFMFGFGFIGLAALRRNVAAHHSSEHPMSLQTL